VEVEVGKSAERFGKRMGRNTARNLGEYYTLIVSLTVFGLSVFISTAVFSTPVSQFVGTIEKAIAHVGGR